MVESKSVVLQMISHTLFIVGFLDTIHELFTRCLLFMTLFTTSTVHSTAH